MIGAEIIIRNQMSGNTSFFFGTGKKNLNGHFQNQMSIGVDKWTFSKKS